MAQGRHNNLINLESRLDGSPELLASLGTRINSFRDGHLINYSLRDVLAEHLTRAPANGNEPALLMF
jgi:hypothetical protein